MVNKKISTPPSRSGRGRIPKKGTRTSHEAQKNKKFLQGAKITRKTKFSKILESRAGAAEILFNAGLHCVGCPMTAQESLEEGCLAHGMNDKDIDKLVIKLNKGDKK